MDGPNSGFGLIHKLPIDILAGIVFFVPGEDIGRLKMTGSKSFWSILKCPNVVKSVKLGDDGIRFKSWPAFMNELASLESLRIENENVQWWSDLGLSIDQLPSALRKLSLLVKGVRWASYFFVNKKTSDRIHLNEHLPHLQELELWDYEATDFDWVYSCPPSLTSLNVYQWKPEIPLPSSLIHFKSTHEVPKVVPLSLETLDLVLHLPHSLPNLTSLSVSRLVDDFLSQPERVSELPRSLTELNLDFWDSSGFGECLSPTTWPFLPPNLRTLSLYGNFACCAATSRQIDPISGATHRVRTYPLELLPKSLTKLSIGDIFEIEPLLVPGSSPSLFPPHLKSLDASGLILGPDAAKQLPSSLTYLSTCNFYEQLSEHLPEGLTHLKYRHALPSPKAIKYLPKALTCFDSGFPLNQEECFDFKTGKMVPIPSFPEFSVSCFACLPANVTSLTLWGYKDLNDDFFKNQNLPNLLSLNFSGDDLSDTSIPLLNRHMTSLNIGTASRITGKCFKDLPRTLTQLTLDGSSSIFDEDIPHLPSVLKYIIIDSATHLSDACIRDFPRSCKNIRIGKNEKISQRCIPDLPLIMASYREAFIVAKWSLSLGQMSRF